MKIAKFKFIRFGEQDAFYNKYDAYKDTLRPFVVAEYWYADADRCVGTFNRGYSGEFSYSIEKVVKYQTLSIAQAFLEKLEEIEVPDEKRIYTQNYFMGAYHTNAWNNRYQPPTTVSLDAVEIQPGQVIRREELEINPF